jgi:ribose transport system substrate-binding protein
MTMRRTQRTLPLLAAAVILAAACGTERESVTGGGGPSLPCEPSEAAQAAYDRSWREAGKPVGLGELEPDGTEVCLVDTRRFARDADSGRPTVAFAAQGPTNGWALENDEAFKLRAKQRGVDVLYASALADANRQVDNIQQLASQKPDAMVVVPMGPGITGQVRAAADEGIPVVLCAGRLAPGSGAVSTVARSYELQATLSAEWVVKQTGGKGKIAMLSGAAGVPTAEFQKAAAEKVFAEHPGIRIVSKQYTGWSPTKSKTVATNLRARHPDLDAIWSDSGISDLGVVEAYQQAGKPVPPLTGDSSNAFLKAVAGTDTKFMISPFPPEQSAACLDTALDVLKGKPVPNRVNVKGTAFTHKEAEKYARPECSDNLTVPSALPQDLLERLELC